MNIVVCVGSGDVDDDDDDDDDDDGFLLLMMDRCFCFNNA